MMASLDERLDRADLLVGRFFHFGEIEVELNTAIRKLFELSPDRTETVCANIEFYKKTHIVRSALEDQDTKSEHKKSLKKLFARIGEANTNRQVAAHAGFKANGSDGVVFHRVTATTGLKRAKVVWTENDCAKMFGQMAAMRATIYCEDMRPVEHSVEAHGVSPEILLV
jgi:hypothetical protein